MSDKHFKFFIRVHHVHAIHFLEDLDDSHCKVSLVNLDLPVGCSLFEAVFVFPFCAMTIKTRCKFALFSKMTK